MSNVVAASVIPLPSTQVHAIWKWVHPSLGNPDGEEATASSHFHIYVCLTDIDFLKAIVVLRLVCFYFRGSEVVSQCVKLDATLVTSPRMGVELRKTSQDCVKRLILNLFHPFSIGLCLI